MRGEPSIDVERQLPIIALIASIYCSNRRSKVAENARATKSAAPGGSTTKPCFKLCDIFAEEKRPRRKREQLGVGWKKTYEN